MLGIRLHADADRYRGFWLQLQRVNVHVRDQYAVDIRSSWIDFPTLQLPKLGVHVQPPGRRQSPARSAKVAAGSPGADLNFVNPDRDIRWPIVVMSRRLGANFHPKLQA